MPVPRYITSVMDSLKSAELIQELKVETEKLIESNRYGVLTHIHYICLQNFCTPYFIIYSLTGLVNGRSLVNFLFFQPPRAY